MQLSLLLLAARRAAPESNCVRCMYCIILELVDHHHRESTREVDHGQLMREVERSLRKL